MLSQGSLRLFLLTPNWLHSDPKRVLWVCMITASGRLRLPRKALDVFPAARSPRGQGRETTGYFICGQRGESTVQFPNHPKKVQSRADWKKSGVKLQPGSSRPKGE